MIRNLLLALAALGCLAAAAPARANSAQGGVGVIWAVDLAHGTITIGRDVYRFTNRTTLTGRDGERLALIDVPVARDENGWLRGVSQATVEFSAVGRPGNLTLTSLELIEPPQ